MNEEEKTNAVIQALEIESCDHRANSIATVTFKVYGSKHAIGKLFDSLLKKFETKSTLCIEETLGGNP